MLFNSVVLILREVLEAAVLVSVLLALSRNLGLGGRWLWLWLSLPFAAVGTVVFASTLDTITDSLDGAGQEVANASLQLLVYLLTLCIVVIAARSPVKASRFAFLMSGTVICAMIREGSEMYLYVTSFASVTEYRTAVFMGSAIGAGIGVSIGVLLYSALAALPIKSCYRLCILMLCLIAAGMVMQATMLLEQADWLPSGKPVWDSSFLISEQSIPGELMYAVFGYESTPSDVQMLLYITSLLLISAAYVLGHFSRRPESVQA
jgi:high-affinity iron transporter